MPVIVPGSNFDYQQLIVTVDNTDVDMNAELTAQALNGYVLNQLFIFPDSSKVILQFSRQVPLP